MAHVDDETKRFHRRLDDKPVRVWTRRAWWYFLGFLSALAYSAIGIWCAEHMHRAPR